MQQKFRGHRALRNSSGFALLILPLTLLVGTSLFYIMIQDWGTQKLIQNQRLSCHHVLLGRFDEIGRELESLLSLNTPMRLAKAHRKAAELNLWSARLTGVPTLIAAAEAAHQIAKTAVQMIKIRQQLHIKRSNWLLFSAIKEARESVSHHLRVEQRQSDLQSFEIQWKFISLPRLAIRAEPISDPDPIYVLEQPFSNRQELELKWQVSQSVRNQHLQNRSKKWIYQNSCAATLSSTEKQNKFHPTLSAGKFSLKRSWHWL